MVGRSRGSLAEEGTLELSPSCAVTGREWQVGDVVLPPPPRGLPSSSPTGQRLVELTLQSPAQWLTPESQGLNSGSGTACV